MKLCAHCGGQNRDQARFCGHCGRPFSGQPVQESLPTPAAAIKKPLLSTKVYAVLAALGWLTLFTPFVTIRACGVQQTYWGIDWIALQYSKKSERVVQEEPRRKESASPLPSLEATLEILHAEHNKKSKEAIQELLRERYRAAPFYLRLFLSVDPVPEASYGLLGLLSGAAWLQWYHLVSWLCVAGLLLCLHTLLNLYGHHHLFAHHAFTFGGVEITPGWGLFALTGIWGALYGLTLLQPGQHRRPEGRFQQKLGPAFPLVLVGVVFLARHTLLRSQAEPPLTEAGAQTASPDVAQEPGRRTSEEKRKVALRKSMAVEPRATGKTEPAGKGDTRAGEKSSVRIDSFLGVCADFTAYAVSDPDGVKLLDLETGQQLPAPTWDPDWGRPRSASCSHALIAILTEGDISSRSVKLFSRKTGELEQNVRGQIDGAAFTPDGRFLAITEFRPSDGYYLVLRDVQGKKAVAELCIGGNGYCSLAVAGRYVAAYESRDDQITLAETETGRVVKTLTVSSLRRYFLTRRREFFGDRMPLALSPAGTLIACGAEDLVILSDRDDEKAVHKLEGHLDVVQAIAFSPNGEMLATAAKDKTIRFWNVKERREVYAVKNLPTTASELIFSPDGKRIAVVYDSKSRGERSAEIHTVTLK